MKTVFSMVLNSVALLLIINDSAWANEIKADAGISAIVLIIGVTLLIGEIKRERRPNRRSSKVDKQRRKDRCAKGKLES